MPAVPNPVAASVSFDARDMVLATTLQRCNDEYNCRRTQGQAPEKRVDNQVINRAVQMGKMAPPPWGGHAWRIDTELWSLVVPASFFSCLGLPEYQRVIQQAW